MLFVVLWIFRPPGVLFYVLFCLAKGGLQRVSARTFDVAVFTLSVFCSHVAQEMLAALPLLSWPSQAKRPRVTRELSILRCGDNAGCESPYALVSVLVLYFQ